MKRKQIPLIYLLFFPILLCVSSVSRADKIYLMPNLASQPNSEVLDKITAGIAPVPLFKDAFGRYIQGRIIRHITGPRDGNPLDPANHDKLLIEAYGKNGQPIAESPLTLSALHVFMVQHDVDSWDDFSYLMSDRHEKLKESFGSPVHRQAFYQLVDPKGEIGLFKGGDIHGPFHEGRVTTFILSGPPPEQTLFSGPMWERADPWHLSPFTGMIPTAMTLVEDAELYSYPLGSEDFVAAVLRARKYRGFPEGFEKTAINAIDMLCSLVHVEPGLIENHNQQLIAHRAQQIGYGCYATVVSNLKPTSPQEQAPNIGTSQPFDLVSREERIDALLDIVLEAGTFKTYIDANPLIDAMGTVSPTGNLNDLKSEGLFRSILDILISNEWVGVSLQLKRKAERVLKLLAFGVDESGRMDNSDSYELDHRYFQSNLVPTWGNIEAEQEKQHARLGFRWFCEYGWGHSKDAIGILDGIFNIVDETSADKAFQKQMVLAIASATRIADPNNKHSLKIADFVNDTVSDIRKNLENGFGSSKDSFFLDLYDEAVAEIDAKSCDVFQ